MKNETQGVVQYLTLHALWLVPGMQVQIKASDLLVCGGVEYSVELHTLVPHVRVLDLVEAEPQEVLVDPQQTLSHHLQREILNQLVLIHRKLHLLHLVHVVQQIPCVQPSVKVQAPPLALRLFE